jgi:replicative DNA helicase
MIDVLKVGLPADVEAERAVLGAVLEDDSAFVHLTASLTPEDFNMEKHRTIFRRMQDLYGEGTRIDLVTLSSQLEKSGQLESVDGRTYIARLNDGMGSVFGIEHYLRIVKEKSILRRYILGHHSFIDEALLNGSSREILERAEQFNRHLTEESAGDTTFQNGAEIITASGGLDPFINEAKAAGIPTPWPRVTREIGWKSKELTILAGRPSVGKTAASLQIAEKAAVHGAPVAFFSLEMSKTELLRRMICARAMLDSNRLRRGEFTYDERTRYRIAAEELAEMPILYNDKSGCTVPAIHAALRRLSSKQRIGLVIVDYLQLMTAPGRTQNRTEEVSKISRGLKLAASELDVPFVVLSQLSRASDHEGRRPRLSDLRDSGSIEQDANNVIFLHSKEKVPYGLVRPVELSIQKQRNGSVGCFDMRFRADICRLEEELEGGI